MTDLGRTASHFYIKYSTVEVFNDMLHPIMTDDEVLAMVAHAQEFEQLKVRDDEMDELDRLTHDYCELSVSGGSENLHGKVNILLQTYLSRGQLDSFSLISDQSYIIQVSLKLPTHKTKYSALNFFTVRKRQSETESILRCEHAEKVICTKTSVVCRKQMLEDYYFFFSQSDYSSLNS